MEIVHSIRRGDSSYKVADFVVAADTLAERAETAYKRITSPIQTFSDQVAADAIKLIRGDGSYQRDDPRIQTIFRGIHKINDIAHDTNPFSKAISGAALGEIERVHQTIFGELDRLEADIGSFNHSSHRYADRPIANPFKGTRPKSAATENPFLRPSSPSDSANPFHKPADSTTATVNPFVRPPSPSRDSANPFRTDRFAPDVLAVPPKTTPSQRANHPPVSAPADTTVRYRDPVTGQLSTRHRNTLPPAILGDDPDGIRCSADGLGIVTAKCEQRRRAQNTNKATK